MSSRIQLSPASVAPAPIAGPQAAEELPFGRILVAVGPGGASEQALDLAAELAVRPGTALRIVHVQPAAGGGGVRGSEDDAVAESLLGNALWSVRARGNWRVDVHRARATPEQIADVIRRAALMFEADLIIIGGSPRLGEPGRANVLAAVLAHAPCPVLVAGAGAVRASRKRPHAEGADRPACVTAGRLE